MATVTTNANGKKKLVYKQDPDGVFRLKRLGEDDKLSTKSDKRTVDDYLNDLIGCTYQVVDPNASKSKKLAEEAAYLMKSDRSEPEDHFMETGAHQQSPDNHSNHSIPATNHSVPARVSSGLHIDYHPTDGPAHDQHLHQNPQHQQSQNPPPQNQQISPPVSPASNMNNRQNIIVESSALHRFFQKLNMSLPIFHVPSFGLGLIIAIIVNQMSPHIIHYAKIGFDYIKVGLAWGIVLGLISWYAGIIKIQDVSSFKQVAEDLVTRLTGRIRHPNPSVNFDVVDDAAIGSAAEDHSPVDGDFAYEPPRARGNSDIVIHDYVNDDTPSPPQNRGGNRPGGDRSRSMARVKTRQKSVSPSRSPKQSRKGTVTNVMPFKAPVRTSPVNTTAGTNPLSASHDPDFRSPSVPNLPSYERNNANYGVPPRLNRLHTADGKSNYSKFVERSKRPDSKHRNSGSIDSFDSSNLKYPPLAPAAHGHKSTLPQLPDEDLPFINEVKLVNHEEGDDYVMDGKENHDGYYGHHDTVSSLPHNLGGNPVKRLNSTMSKKSVLGTRANYNRFLENAQYLDHD